MYVPPLSVKLIPVAAIYQLLANNPQLEQDYPNRPIHLAIFSEYLQAMTSDTTALQTTLESLSLPQREQLGNILRKQDHEYCRVLENHQVSFFCSSIMLTALLATPAVSLGLLNLLSSGSELEINQLTVAEAETINTPFSTPLVVAYSTVMGGLPLYLLCKKSWHSYSERGRLNQEYAQLQKVREVLAPYLQQSGSLKP